MCIPLIIGAAAMGIGSAVASGIGSENARVAQESATEKAMRLQREVYDQQRNDMAPWLKGGQQSLADLMGQMQAGGFDKKFDPSQLANDPGYQFRMAEGQKALERSASARGMLDSGGALKSLTRYSQGVASDEYQNAWNRNQAENTGRYNRLANLAGVGQTAAQSLSNAGGQYGNNMGNLYGAQGNARAAGAMGVANAVSGGMQTLGNLGMMAAMGGFGGGGQQIPTQGQSFAGSMGMGGGRGFGLNYGGW